MQVNTSLLFLDDLLQTVWDTGEALDYPCFTWKFKSWKKAVLRRERKIAAVIAEPKDRAVCPLSLTVL